MDVCFLHPTDCLTVVSFTRIMPFLSNFIFAEAFHYHPPPIFLVPWLYLKIFPGSWYTVPCPILFSWTFLSWRPLYCFYLQSKLIACVGLLHSCWPGLSSLLDLDPVFIGSHFFFLGLFFIEVHPHVSYFRKGGGV